MPGSSTHRASINTPVAGPSSQPNGRQSSVRQPNGRQAAGRQPNGRTLPLDPTITQIIKKPRLAGWKVKYRDFLPTHRRDGGSPSDLAVNFQALVDRANEWLRKNSDVQVKTCETLTWHSHDTKKLGDSEQMVISKRVAENATNYFLRGLRLWLVPVMSHDRHHKQQQTLCFQDFTPEGSDNIQSLVNKANRKLDAGSLRGEMLTIETIYVPQINGNLDSGDTWWSESMDEDSPYVFCLRVFYNSQRETRVSIGIKDIVPMLSIDGYEGFPELCDRANTWLRDQSDVLITNMQSLMVQKDDGPHSETGSACYYTAPGINTEHPLEFFRILRTAYIKPSGDQVTEIPIIYPFTYESFTPEIVTKGSGDKVKERMERMKECYSRVQAHLKATGKGRGADIICVETVVNPMQLIPCENAQSQLESDMKYMLTIRLYLTAQIREIDGNILRPMITPRAANSKSRKTIDDEDGSHPGPIFLGSVVRREFRYRWLVLAVSVFTCMTIIVVVSVVYSNQ